MTDLADGTVGDSGGPGAGRVGASLGRLMASPGFQRWAARVPGLRRIVRAEGAAIFDLMQGFVRSQVLSALVEFRTLHRLADGPQPVAHLAAAAGVPVGRMAVLLQAGAGVGLLRRRRDGRFALSRRGAAFLGVPGLEAMVRHHRLFYDDLADPAAFFRDGPPGGLARFWPYVFGAGAAEDPARAAAYSRLMADSQALVAADTLRLVSLGGIGHLMDVGGGTGAFVAAVAAAYPGMRFTLVDLPRVLDGAGARLAAQGLTGRVTLAPGSFRDSALPGGAEAVSLVRVLYDHDDATVAGLLGRVRDALPPGGRLIVSEPMSGGARPDPATDVYFALYTLAMQTGRTRSGAEIAALLAAAGFEDVRPRRGDRPYVTSVVTARRAADR